MIDERNIFVKKKLSEIREKRLVSMNSETTTTTDEAT